MTAISTISTEELDRRFDDGESLEEYFDMEHPVVRRVDTSRKINIAMPEWMIGELDATAKHHAVSRQAVINMWIGERLAAEKAAAH